jgi:hypothetical protein
MNKQPTKCEGARAPKWRKDALSIKEFRNLSTEDKDEYLVLLLGLDKKELGDADEYILNFHCKVKLDANNSNFFSL